MTDQFAENIVIGSAANTFSNVFVYPLARLRMMLVINHGSFPRIPQESFIDTLIRAAKVKTFHEFYRGFTSSMIRHAPQEALHYALKERFKVYMVCRLQAKSNEGIFRRFAANFTAGGLSAIFYWIVFYPLDLLRFRFAGDFLRSARSNTKPLFQKVIGVVHREGVSELYRGFSISATRDFLFRGLYFGLYDSILPQQGYNYAFPLKLIAAHAIVSAGLLVSNPFEIVRRRFISDAVITSDSTSWPRVYDTVTKVTRETRLSKALTHPHAIPYAGYSYTLTIVLIDELKRLFGSRPIRE